MSEFPEHATMAALFRCVSAVVACCRACDVVVVVWWFWHGTLLCMAAKKCRSSKFVKGGSAHLTHVQEVPCKA